MYLRVVMYLSKNGDSVELKLSLPPDSLRCVSYETDNIHPILKGAKDCNSFDKVLTLLRTIKDNSECQQFVNLRHMHNQKYEDHGRFFLKGVAHHDSIDELINFVEARLETPAGWSGSQNETRNPPVTTESS